MTKSTVSREDKWKEIRKWNLNKEGNKRNQRKANKCKRKNIQSA